MRPMVATSSPSFPLNERADEVVAALLGLLLHSWLVFGCLLPILLVFCVLIGLLRG